MMMIMMMMGGNDQVNAQNEGGCLSGDSGLSNGSNLSNGNNVKRESDRILKKGPWTTAEDAVLIEHVRTHGEGNWNAVQKNTGLARCGKSCRLRWANHLRPNLKKGAFSPEEERVIIELHAKIGNKWARMATQLPGRTDNEIKNYWNTRVKRRQRQGLPLYPPDIQPLYYQHPLRRYSQPPPLSSPPTTTTPFSFQTPIMSLHTSTLPSALHHLHIPRRPPPPPPQNLLYNPHSAETTLPLRPLHSPSSASTPPTLHSPSGSTPPPPPISPLPSPHNQPPFPTLPLFEYPTSITTTAADYDFFHSNKRFKLDESQFNNNNNNNSFMLPFSHEQKYSNLPSSSSKNLHQPHLDSGFFYPFKTNQDGNSGDGLLEDMLREAQALAAEANNGLNKELPKEMNSATQLDQEEEDYSRLINDDGPTSMGMAINEWPSNDSGESSGHLPSAITDNENQPALDIHGFTSLFPADHAAAMSSGVQSWDNFPGIR